MHGDEVGSNYDVHQRRTYFGAGAIDSSAFCVPRYISYIRLRYIVITAVRLSRVHFHFTFWLNLAFTIYSISHFVALFCA